MTERFTLLSELGRGGMGVVWKARDEETGQIVALKLLREAYAEDPDYLGRFARELELAKRIHSDHVVKVLGYGVRKKVPYLALEYVDGQSLRDLIASHGLYTWDETKALLAQIARGLGDAHAAGVIHRDVKPSNVLLAPDGTAKLTDFGIARGLDLTRVTATSTLLGTPAYLAPEGPEDERSDLYSLGVIGYELLVGTPTFEGKTYQAVMLAHLRTPPDLTRLPAEAQPILGRLLAKDPAERPGSAGELVDALAEPGTVTALNPAVEAAAPSAAGASDVSRHSYDPPAIDRHQLHGRRRRQLIAVLLGALAVLMVASGIWGAVSGFGRGTGAASATPSGLGTKRPAQTSMSTATPASASTQGDNPAPTTLPSGWAYSDLDGVPAPAAQAHALPMAVMISDNATARPESGVSSASIVYQAYVDGGEDRYMMIMQEGTATDIGPVRGAGPYYVTWASEYRALLAHDGGTARALQLIPANATSVYDMDASNGGSCPYHLIATRQAPQNEYTDSATLISCAGKKSYPSTYQGLPTRTFRDDTPLARRPATQTVTIVYRTVTVGYQYDRGTDSYLRLINGKPEIDPANGSQVFARTIAVMYQAVTIDPESEPGYSRSLVQNVGTGQATLFLEGQTVAATWKKDSSTALTRFYDASGAEIPFVRGEIFIQSVSPGSEVTAK